MPRVGREDFPAKKCVSWNVKMNVFADKKENRQGGNISANKKGSFLSLLGTRRPRRLKKWQGDWKLHIIQ